MTPQPGGRNGQLARLVWHLYCHDSMGQHMSWIASAPNEPCPTCRENQMEQTELLRKMHDQMKALVGWQVLQFAALVVLLWRLW